MKYIFSKVRSLLSMFFVIGLLAGPSVALAAPSTGGSGGLGKEQAAGKVKEVAEMIQYILYFVAAAVCTIAFFICGYKIMFGGQTVRELTPIIVGAVVIASASALGGFFMGS